VFVAVQTDGDLAMENSVMEHNSATISGGALYLGSDSPTSTVRIGSSTLVANTARYGGAVSAVLSTVVELRGSVVHFNIATDPTGTMGDGGGR
jgi:hypothetical protein